MKDIDSHFALSENIEHVLGSLNTQVINKNCGTYYAIYNHPQCV